jgi:hypothetical protein
MIHTVFNQHDDTANHLFNPLPWPRSGIVEVDGRRRFAKDVPSCGYITLSDQSDQSDTADTSSTP